MKPGWMAALTLVGASLAAGPAAALVYTCVDAQKNRLTSDRPIPQCSDREQRILNNDGSFRGIHPPNLTAEERARLEDEQRKKEREIAAKKDAARRDRNLMNRYRNEAAHNRARQAALDDVEQAIHLSESRIQQLRAERKPLADEAEFYKGKRLPFKLRQQLDANDASTEAQQTLIANQQAEKKRINALFDAELAHLRKLWGGAPPGSITYVPPVLDGASAPAAGASAASRPAR